ncbi:MAG: porin family protein [Muribaculaceae bacterium]|nr:porin family protein [Muribaculaceae bacterium]
MSIIRKIFAVALLSVSAVGSYGQSAIAPYKFDFGAGLGMSGYEGDANSGFPFRHPGFTADVRAGYILDTRWAFRASLSTMGLSGSTTDMTNVLPAGTEHFDFTSQVFDLGLRGEFNFFSYGIGETYKRLRRWSPYLAVGVGVSLASSGGNTAVAPSLPLAFGVKFKLKERLNLMGEFSMTKVFSDHVDGANMADINGIKTDFYKNTDWFARFTIGITYEFGKRCETCHYVN